MTCNTDVLSDYLDDELASGARREVDLHLAACAACRGLLAELAIVKETAPLLVEIDRVPDADLWPGVAARVRGGRARTISLSWMQAIAAGVALAVLSGSGVWMAMRPGREAGGSRGTATVAGASGTDVRPIADFGDAAYESAVKDLREALENGRNRLDPRTIQVLETNLAAIDQAIGDARKALEADPSNVSLNSYLAGVRRRKLDLLRTASELTLPAS